MVADKNKDSGEIVCEFFGIEITTKNPRVAKVLKSDIHEILNTDITFTTGKRSAKEPDESESDLEPTIEIEGAEF